MARSLRKTKIFGFTYTETEKQDKRRWNRRFRKISKKLIRLDKDAPIKIQGITNRYDGAKDGRRYWSNAPKKEMRK